MTLLFELLIKLNIVSPRERVSARPLIMRLMSRLRKKGDDLLRKDRQMSTSEVTAMEKSAFE